MDRPGRDEALTARRLSTAEWAVAAALTALLLALHVVFLFGAGGLWRDEAASVNFANLPSFGDLWAQLPHESFPMLWFWVLRVWVKLAAAGGDPAIRLLGLVVGIGLLATLWRNARGFGLSTPLVSMAVLGFNSAVLVHGDSIRGHGLGMMFGLLAFGLVWDYVDVPSPGRLVVALVAALGAVHCLYFAVVFVFGACIGGAAVALKRKSRRTALIVVFLGAATGISLLPYTGAIRQRREMSDTFRVEVNLPLIGRKLTETFESTSGMTLWLWAAATVLAVAALIPAIRHREVENGAKRRREAALFGGIALLAGVPIYLLILKAVGFLGQPWYYVALLAFVAGCVDAPISLLARTPRGRMVRLAAVAIAVVLAVPQVLSAARTRRTNVDLVAEKVAKLAVAGDLIIVNPWYLGITFDRYYRGRADWVTVPPLSSHSLHRYDLLKEQMTACEVMTPLLEEVQESLRNGHRVFWVGELFIPAAGEVPTEPPPAPIAPWGWADAPYYEAWGSQAGYLIKSHARAASRMDVPAGKAVNSLEDVPLFAFSGWWNDKGGLN